MAKNWWFKFDFKVWRTDSNLRRCSLETRAFWLEVLCAMHEAGTPSLTGSYVELARLVGCETNQVAKCVTELSQTCTANVTQGNGFVTLTSRRLKRELSTKEHNRLRKQRQRSHANVTPQSHDRVISNKKEVISKEEREAAAPPALADDQEADFSIYDEPMVAVYREFFPDASLSPLLQNLIITRVENETLWRKALTYWQYNSYRANSVGKICDYYDELVEGKHNGTDKRNGYKPKRTDADVFAESADFYAKYPA